MPTRRTHRKSRRGCLTCKQRRVKCDEGGPPCGACKLRATSCEYASPVSSRQTSPLNGSAVTTDPTPDWDADEPIFPADTRLLELQLMSRWTTVTYKSFCSKVAEDDHVWQMKVSHMSLQHDFLLNGLFALSAFEIGSSSKCRDRARYISAAVEYQALALSSFWPQLQNITPDTHEAVLCFSMALMVLALASAQFASDSASGDSDSMVQNTITHFELLRGCATVMAKKENFIAESPYMSKLKRFEDLPRIPLDPHTEGAIAKLNEANESRITASIGDSYERRVTQVAYWEACKKAILLLQDCFAKCVNIDYQGYVLGWLNMAGDNYIKAVKADDRVAILILMYWGVLIERLGHRVWWAQKFGSLLVEEISNGSLGEDADTRTNDVVTCARELIRSPDGVVLAT